jgi:hypothetical protein
MLCENLTESHPRLKFCFPCISGQAWLYAINGKNYQELFIAFEQLSDDLMIVVSLFLGSHAVLWIRVIVESVSGSLAYWRSWIRILFGVF